MASAERVVRLRDTKRRIVDPTHPREHPHVRGEITFENVSFAYNLAAAGGEIAASRYNEGDWVLRDVSFKISAAESVAIVGATGAGKTSIISLLARFYDGSGGAIRIDGHDLRAVTMQSLREQFRSQPQGGDER